LRKQAHQLKEKLKKDEKGDAASGGWGPVPLRTKENSQELRGTWWVLRVILPNCGNSAWRGTHPGRGFNAKGGKQYAIILEETSHIPIATCKKKGIMKNVCREVSKRQKPFPRLPTFRRKEQKSQKGWVHQICRKEGTRSWNFFCGVGQMLQTFAISSGRKGNKKQGRWGCGEEGESFRGKFARDRFQM